MCALPLETLRTIPSLLPKIANKLLLTLPLDDQQRMSSHLTIVPLRFKQVLHKQGDTIRDVYFPCGGAMSLTKTMEDGATAEIATIGNEGMIGSSVYFGDDRSFGEVIVQVADGDGLKMAVQPFITEMRRHGALYDRVIRYSQALSAQVMQTTVCNSLHSAEQRCCRWMLMTRDRVSSDDLKLTQEFLSVMLGVRRPTVTLIVGELQQAGLIETRRGMIHLVDRLRLEQVSCECYAVVKASLARLLPEIPGPTG